MGHFGLQVGARSSGQRVSRCYRATTNSRIGELTESDGVRDGDEESDSKKLELEHCYAGGTVTGWAASLGGLCPGFYLSRLLGEFGITDLFRFSLPLLPAIRFSCQA